MAYVVIALVAMSYIDVAYMSMAYVAMAYVVVTYIHTSSTPIQTSMPGGMLHSLHPNQESASCFTTRQIGSQQP